MASHSEITARLAAMVLTLCTPAVARANQQHSAESLAKPLVTSSSSRLSIVSDLYVRVNPEGVMLYVGPVYNHAYSLGSSILLRNLYVRGGLLLGSNPAYGQASAFVEASPLAVLQLKVQADWFGFYGANGALLRFADRDSRFGRSEQKSLKGQEATGTGYRVLLTPVLRARVGPIVARNQTDVAYYQLDSEPGYYLEWEYDTLLKNRDWVVSNRAALLGVLWEGKGTETLLLGPAHEVTHAFGTDITRHRLELMIYLEPATRWLGLDRPRLFGLTGLNLRDRNRDNQPFLVVGAGADFDIWSR
ncbi:MAG TPA: hypothetical protein VIV60_04540 [Polyangiaceae bacterium]